MAIPGERFVLDLSDDEAEQPVDQPRAAAAPLIDLIGEIKERTPKAATAPTPKTSTGFPVAKDRRGRSAFKQRRAASHNAAAASNPVGHARPAAASNTQPGRESSMADEEKQIIDEENNQRLAAMSDAEIESERAELMSNLSPSLVERLLRRANKVDEPSNSDQHYSAVLPTGGANLTENKTKSTAKSVSFDLPEAETEKSTERSVLDGSEEITTAIQSSGIDERAPAAHPPDLLPASEFPNGPVHFPTPPPRQGPVPNLDPNSPSFYADLQEHYFPDIPHDPSTLSWLKPVENDKDDHATSSPYHSSSSATTIVPSALRFSLRGEILPPSESLSLPTSLGLHHHADDPEAAGYTISELSILSRSTFPAQRCVAWQVIGRVLYRLGKGEFGDPEQDLVDGLWTVIEREAVVPRMMDEAEGGGSQENKPQIAATGPKSNIGKHASAKAWAVEGIWLWQMGGGKRGILKSAETRM
ncbi:uncharacterized protein TRUGW13939_11652 [Talaromyces rugulosus]|uniref:Transcription factor Rba50 n=1 Tax=Talaromyces rugulosus TaxID=121627 RepID=A0A7H8REM4_TALRU|nr:uncharacterized protein TRUGW13939_11652 [Talaromyces rugulosus]QKX64478.1 hypothetical protein TRUGW13939_11652 [Talaromyces rugulosus]